MKLKMKDITRSLGLALLAFLTVQCDKNQVDDKPTQFDLPSINVEFSDFTGTESTKALVSADGIVKCDASDELKVFVETQGIDVTDWEEVTHKYLTNSADCGSGIFKPETPMILDDLDSKINMYVLSPWNDLITDPIGGEDSYSEFSFDGQIQDYNDLTAHLSNYTLLTGIAENIVAGDSPKLKLEHKSALLKLTIENQLRKPLQVQAVTITAPEGVNIAGSYKIDFKAGAPLIPVSPKNQAVLTIRNAKTIQSDENVDLFIMTPEFSLKAGQTINVDVTSTEGVWNKIITIPEDITIKAGCLNSTTIERNKYMVEMLWSKTHGGLNLGSVNALGVAINDQYMFIQEYDSRCHLYNRNTGEYLKEVIQGGPYTFMLNADVDDAGHFITARHNIYGAGFIVFRYDLDTDSHTQLINFEAGSGCPADMGYAMSVSGDLTKGEAYIYGCAPGEPKIYCWKFVDGVKITADNDPIIITVPDVADNTWTIANVERATIDEESEHYVAYVQYNPEANLGGSKFQILDKTNAVIATMDPANHLYRILDFKVFQMNGKTLLATTEQGHMAWDPVRMQIFDITNRDNLALKPGDAGYDKFCLFTSPIIGVTNYNTWGNVSVYVDEANNEAYITSGAVGNAEQNTSVRLFKIKFYN